MDVPKNNQNQPPAQTWGAQSGWPTVYHPLPSFHHLGRGPPPAPQTPQAWGSSPQSGRDTSASDQHQLGPEAPPSATSLPENGGGSAPPCHPPVLKLHPPPQVCPYPPHNSSWSAASCFHPNQPPGNAASGPGANLRDGSDPPSAPAQRPAGNTNFIPTEAEEDRRVPQQVKVMLEDRAEWEGRTFLSEPLSPLPPLPTTSCVMKDGGNASPSVIRSNSYCLPCEAQVGLLSRLPLGALITPLGGLNAGEGHPPLCKDSERVDGCGSCGASMCPPMSWQDCGQRFYCPFCGKLNEVAWKHYQPTKGVNGVRVDADHRPELSLGSYEVIGSQQEPAALLLAVDVSASAQRGGHLEFMTQQIQAVLSSLSREVPVGLMSYDSRIHLYDLSPELSRPHMLVIADTEELQLPVREGLLVPLRDCMESVLSILQVLPHISGDHEGCGGAPVELPIQAALAVLQGLKSPGKLLIFHSADLMETGDTNSSSGLFGSNKPKSVFQPSEQSISLAKECVSQGCGVHMFVLSQQDVGGAWPGHIPHLTGGALHSYAHLQGKLDRDRFSRDLRRTVETDFAFRAELRIFVSKDLRVSGCYGMFVPGPNPAHVTMATLDRRTTLAVELAHTRALDEARGAAIQTVLSYSLQTGETRTRVHTLTLRCSRHLQDAFRNFQAQTLLSFYCKKMYCSVLERPLQELREELQTDTTEALASYRKHCSTSCVSAGQLVLPRFLRALPVFLNSLRKSEVLLPGLRSSIHQRLQLRCCVLAMDPRNTVEHFYPPLLPLLLSDGGGLSPGEPLRCTAASLQPTGLYLLHPPLILLLWVGSQVPACTLAQLFSAGCFSSLASGEIKLPVLDTPLSVYVRSLIDDLSERTLHSQKLLVVKQGDACEEELQRLLVEDKSPNGGASYADYLYHLHFNSVRLLQ
ncbi:protein transport protein Sec24C-like isoform X2 [Oryzias latipes]|uniref:protein transport protein Sec24C-like isoform X2 n=1 Tax=Oryzias latipes TaxID=8090 RepID=UPI000CE23C30|nr:protein transport protein Sec24C-like isoform X2 [Oryzias latipes]